MQKLIKQPTLLRGKAKGQQKTIATFIIDVFKTDVQEVSQGARMVDVLHAYFPGSEINFDLDDCDKILRIKHHGVLVASIIQLLNKHGFQCEELED